MGRYDEDTQRFMDEVSDKPHPAERAIKQAIGVTDALVHKRLSVPRLVSREIVKSLVKEGSDQSILQLYSNLNDKFGRSWWAWEPETLWTELPEPTDELKSAVQALQVVLNTHYPFEHWHVFEKVGHAFNLNHVDFGLLQPLDADEAARTCAILRAIRPKEAFDPEVLTYIAVCAHSAGLVWLPRELFPEGCQAALDQITFDNQLRDLVAKTWPKVIQGDSALALQTQKLEEIREYSGRG